MVQLVFYGDGSGEHGKGTFVVAGYLAGGIDWFDLEQDWIRELERPPKLQYFKARECLHLDGQFKDWTTIAANHRRDRFLDIIGKNVRHLTEVNSHISWDGWRAVIGDGVFKKAFYHPYYFCFNGIAAETIMHVNREIPKHDGRIAFVMDTESNKNLDVDVQSLYNKGIKSLPSKFSGRMGSTTCDSDIAFPLFQVADLAAWSIRADKEGLDSCLASIRQSVAHRVEREWKPAGIARLVKETEDKFKEQFSNG
jgi:hypothetical protein